MQTPTTAGTPAPEGQGADQTLTLRVGSIDREWGQYRLFQGTPILVKNAEGWEKSNYKAIFRDAVNPELVAILSRDYELFPNEELKKRMDAWASENKYELYQDERYSHYTKTGNGAFFTYLPRGETNGNYIVRGDDPVKVGFCARNSIDGSVGFGLDVFTFRGKCWNGSIVLRGEERAFNTWELGQAAAVKVYHKHTPKLSEYLDSLGEHIDSLRTAGEQVISYYRQLVAVRLNQEIAQVLANSYLPKKYHPFDVDKDGKAHPDTLKTPDDMWSVYNSYTEAIWHNQKGDIGSKFQYFNALHNTLRKAVPPLTVRSVV